MGAERGDTFNIPFICLGEFWRTMTESRGYGLPADQVQLLIRRMLRAMPALMPPQRFNEQWLNLAGRLRPAGAEIFDVQIGALCLHHEVSELWTFDARFPRVDGLRIVNPLEPWPTR